MAEDIEGLSFAEIKQKIEVLVEVGDLKQVLVVQEEKIEMIHQVILDHLM